MGTAAYRPANWVGPPMVSITVPAVNNGSTSNSLSSAPTGPCNGTPLFSATPAPVAASPTTYVFDAILDVEHEQRLEKTHHPVQTGADVSSHAYLMPPSLVLNVLMSDVVESYTSGNFTGNPSKSVSAYQTMLKIQASRQPLTITTRLRTYTNMLITSLPPREDSKTITGLRMRVSFEGIFTASTSTVPNSARSNDTALTGLGAVSPTPIADAIPATVPPTPAAPVSQFSYPSQAASSPYTLPTNDMFTNFLADVPGAGNISSIPGQQGLP